jgi:hypothetical protein
MIITVQNQTAAELAIGFPLGVTLDALGGAVDTFVGGVSMRDLVEGEDKGDSAFKRLNLLKQEGKITMSIAVDANDDNILDEANEL